MAGVRTFDKEKSATGNNRDAKNTKTKTEPNNDDAEVKATYEQWLDGLKKSLAVPPVREMPCEKFLNVMWERECRQRTSEELARIAERNKKKDANLRAYSKALGELVDRYWGWPPKL